jgi:hypothetical protein
MRKSIVLLILIIFFTESFAAPVNNTTVISQFVSDFVSVISKNQFRNLKTIANFNEKESASIFRFLGDAHVLPYQKESLAKIISTSTSIVITPVYYESILYREFGDGYTVYFSKSNNVTAVLDRKKQWLLDYAACDFFVKNGKVNFGLTFCYDGTEGAARKLKCNTLITSRGLQDGKISTFDAGEAGRT